MKRVANNIADMISRHPVRCDQPVEVGALEMTARKGTSEAGYVRDYPTAEDIKEAEDREGKITT